MAWSGTLLGPEETGRRPLISLPEFFPSRGRAGGRGGGGVVLSGASGVIQGFCSFRLVTGGMWVGWLSVF
jgi:hypothetical protein